MTQMIKKESNSLVELQETQKLCQLVMQTPHYKKIGVEGIYAIVQKAKSIGVDPLDALNGSFYFVQGKVELTSTMMNDLIRRRGHSITKDKKSDETICILHGKRKDNGDTWCESFSIEDAKQAGIYRNQWIKYPKDMLFARALSRLARQLFPDVIKGCYVQEEIAQALEATIEAPQFVEEEIVMTLFDMKDAIENNIELDDKGYLFEYLEYCRERVKKPMRKVIDSWIDNPEPFKSHYSKWVSKKKLDSSSDLKYEEKSLSSPLENQA